MSPQRRRPGRPPAAHAVDRGDILDGALRAIADGGYQALSMRGLARSLGVSLATVQHHFGTKADLFRAAGDRLLADADRRRSEEPRRDLYQRILNLLDASSAHPGALAGFLGDRSPGHEERLAHFADRFAGLLGEPDDSLVELQLEAGAGRAVDARALMVLLTIGISSIAGAPEATRAIYGLDLHESAERTRLAEALTEIIGNGIFGSEPTGPSEAPRR